VSEPRRRVVRPAPAAPPAPDPERQRRLARLRDRLERERNALARWFAKLRRAFHAVEKSQGRVTRLERQLRRGQT
jgi:hypothetical protein